MINRLWNTSSPRLIPGEITIMKYHTTFLESLTDTDFLVTPLEDASVIGSIKPPRVIFTQKQLETMGSLQNGFKPLYKQSRLFEVCKSIINDYMVRSNGGNIPTEINQKKLSITKVKGKPLNYDIITKSMKFFIGNNILKVHSSHCAGRNSIFYVGGQFMDDCLDPIITRTEYTKSLYDNLTEKYRISGFDPKSRSTCKCCNTSRRAVDFQIFEDKNCLSPVCKQCYIQNIDTCKSILRAFHYEYDTMICMDRSRELDDMDEDYQIDLIIAESIQNDFRFN